MSCAYLTWYTAQSIEGPNKATGKRKRFSLLSPGAEDSVSPAFGHQNFQLSIPKACLFSTSARFSNLWPQNELVHHHHSFLAFRIDLKNVSNFSGSPTSRRYMKDICASIISLMVNFLFLPDL